MSISTEYLFKNVIDWKFFNYLVNKITKYEDMGYYVMVCIHTSTNFMHHFKHIYTYTNDKGLDDDGYYVYISKKEVQDVYKVYKDNGIFYYVDIYSSDKITYEDACIEFGQSIEKYGNYFINKNDDGVYIKKRGE